MNTICARALLRACVLSLLATVCLLSASPATAATVTWDGGGADILWSNLLNWDTGVPVTGDDVVIPAGLGTITFDAGPETLNTLVCSSTLDLHGSLTLTGLLSDAPLTGRITGTNGAFSLAPGSGTSYIATMNSLWNTPISIGAGNTLAVNTFSGATSDQVISGGGTFRVVSFDGDERVTLDNVTVENFGTWTHRPNSVSINKNLQLNNGTTFHNMPGSTLDCTNETYGWGITASGGATFTNEGLIRLRNQRASINGDLAFVQTSTGIVQHEYVGSIQLLNATTISIDGVVDLVGASQFNMTGSSGVTLEAGATVIGASSTLTVENATILCAPTAITAGTLVLTGAGNHLTGNLELNNLRATTATITFDTDSELTIHGLLSNTENTNVVGPGTLRIAPGASASTKALTGKNGLTVINEGYWNQYGNGGWNVLKMDNAGGPVTTLINDGTLYFSASGATLSCDGTAPAEVFRNYGTLQFASGGAVTGLWDFATTGDTVLDSGTLSITGAESALIDGVVDIAGTGHLYTIAGGSLTYGPSAWIKGATAKLTVRGGTFQCPSSASTGVDVGTLVLVSSGNHVSANLAVSTVQATAATLEIHTPFVLRINGSFTNTENTNVIGPGTLHIAPGASATTKAFTGTQGLTVWNEGYWNQYGNGGAWNNFTMSDAGLTVAALINDGTLVLSTSGCKLKSGGALTQIFENNGVLQFSGTGTKTFQGLWDFTNPGTIRVTDGIANITTTLSSLSGGTLTEGTLDLYGELRLAEPGVSTLDAVVHLRNGAAKLVGASAAQGFLSNPNIGDTGELRIYSGASLTTSGLMTSTGLVHLEGTGILAAGTGFELGTALATGRRSVAVETVEMRGGTLSSSGPVTLLSGEMNGGGTIAASLCNSALVHVQQDSVLNVSGDFEQGASGALKFGIASSGVAEHGVLAVTGTATVAGGLELDAPGALTSGHEFPVVTWGPASVGTFSFSETLPSSLPVGSEWVTAARTLNWVGRVDGVYNATSLDVGTAKLQWVDAGGALEKEAPLSALVWPGAAPATTHLSASAEGSTLYALLDPGASATVVRIDPTAAAIVDDHVLVQDVAAIAAGATRKPGTASPPGSPIGRGIRASVLSPATGRYTKLGMFIEDLGVVRGLAEITFLHADSTDASLDLLAYSPRSNLFALDNGIGGPRLWRLNLGSAEATLVGTPGAMVSGSDGMTFLGNELWVSNSGTGKAFHLSVATGSILSPGPIAVPVGSGLTRRDCVSVSDTFIAADKLNDGGGVVHLAWDTYLPPSASAVRYEIWHATDPCDLAMNYNGASVDSIAAMSAGGGDVYDDTSGLDFKRRFYRLDVYGVPTGSKTGSEVLLDTQYSGGAISRPNPVISEVSTAAPAPFSGRAGGAQIELHNPAPTPLDLNGYRLSNGFEVQTLSGIIPSTGFVSLLASIELDPDGGTLALLPPDGSDFELDSVSWGTEGGAPAVPDGFTINRVPGTTPEDPDALSFEIGSPSFGLANDVPTPLLASSIVINEVYFAGVGGEDYVELMNPLGSTVVLDQFAISDGAGFLDVMPSGVTLNPGELFVLNAMSPDPFVRDLTATTFYLYQITESGAFQRIDQVGWGSNVPELAPTPFVAPNDALVRVPDGLATYLGEQGANWIESGGGVTLFHGPQSPGLPNVAASEVTLSVDPMGGGDFTTISAAMLVAAPGTKVLVEPGTYAESVTLAAGVDLTGLVSGSEQVIITGDGFGPALVATGLDATSQLNKLVIQSPTGGLQLNSSSTTVRNVIFDGNFAVGDGAAVAMNGGAPQFNGCLFQNNVAGANGGAVNVLAGTPSFEDCLFVLNSATDGAAIYQAGGSTSIANCVFDRNTAVGGVLHASGGDITTVYSIVTNSLTGAALRAPAGTNTFSCGLVFSEATSTPGGETGVSTADVLTVDPLFCNPATLNYAYSESSPLVGLAATCGSVIGTAGAQCASIPTAAPVIAPPSATAFHLAAPNPFGSATTLRFDLARAGNARIDIYDVRGRRVNRALAETPLRAGRHSLRWNGRDQQGRHVASGVYFAVLRLDGQRVGKTQRLVRLK